MARDGIQRLADMQLDDGGWGWFSGFGEHSSPHTTALVVHGLQIGRQNDLALPQGMLERGIGLAHELPGQADPAPGERRQRDQAVQEAGRRRRRLRLHGPLRRRRPQRRRCSASSTATEPSWPSTASACSAWLWNGSASSDKLAMVLQNVRQYLVEDDENQTAYLKLPNEGYWWSWHGSETETDAFYLKLLAADRPQGPDDVEAGQVRPQQPQARLLLELDPRHGVQHRGPGRLPQGQRREQARHDRHGRRRRTDPQGGLDHPRRPVQLRRDAHPRRRRRSTRANTRSRSSRRGRDRSTTTPT